MVMKLGKVAICISGQLRTGLLAYECFNRFFGHLNADIFYHTWTLPPETSQAVQALYKPTAFLETGPPTSRVSSFTNMFYSIMLANELKKKYEIKNDFRYDLVIKTRFDLIFPEHNRFPTTPINKRTIYSTSDNTGFNHTDYENHGVSDILFWGDSESMDIATNTYMYYNHVALRANEIILEGRKLDPVDYYFSPGNLIYSRCIKNNIAFKTPTHSIGELPWREDVSHLNPVTDIAKIRERYQQP